MAKKGEPAFQVWYPTLGHHRHPGQGWPAHLFCPPHLPLGPRQLKDLLPHREEPLALVLEANLCGLHSLNTQLPLAPPM